MLKLIAVVALLFTGLPAYSAADGAFGKIITGKSLGFGVDKCSSTRLVSQAVEESGINFVDGESKELFGCDQLKEKALFSNGGALNSACRDGKKIRCYSDGTNSSVCVVNPRQIDLDKVYGDAGKVVDHRPRFDGLYIFKKSATGHSREKSWQMDANGCDPTAANMFNPMGSEAECRALISAFASGGYIYRPNISKQKFCGGELDADVVGSIDRLHDCIESYPQLRSARAQNSGNGDTKNSTEKLIGR